MVSRVGLAQTAANGANGTISRIMNALSRPTSFPALCVHFCETAHSVEGKCRFNEAVGAPPYHFAPTMRRIPDATDRISPSVHARLLSPSAARPKLLLADVDGTLVTKEKILTDRAKEAVKKLRAAGIEFAITSGRPPRGMQMLIEPARRSPRPSRRSTAGCSSSRTCPSSRSACSARTSSRRSSRSSKTTNSAPGFTAKTIGSSTNVTARMWTARNGPSSLPPIVVDSYEGKMDDVAKIVGVSDDLDAVARCEKAVREAFGGQVGTNQSTPNRDGTLTRRWPPRVRSRTTST